MKRAVYIVLIIVAMVLFILFSAFWSLDSSGRLVIHSAHSKLASSGARAAIAPPGNPEQRLQAGVSSSTPTGTATNSSATSPTIQQAAGMSQGISAATPTSAPSNDTGRVTDPVKGVVNTVNATLQGLTDLTTSATGLLNTRL